MSEGARHRVGYESAARKELGNLDGAHRGDAYRRIRWKSLDRRSARDRLVIPGYTHVMKTAISVPDETYHEASRRAQELGVSRSEFFSRAAARYANELDAESITEQINQAVDAQRPQDDSALAAVVVGRRVLEDTLGEW